MSYYFNNPYNFTSHGLTRIKTRLKLVNLNDIEISSYCLKLINQSSEIIETKSFKYILISNTNFYFIIKKAGNLVLTLTSISPSKLITILEQNL